jgi:hypothetical protein
LLCSSSVLDFSLSCVKRLSTAKSNIRQKWLHTYYLRYTHTDDTDDDDDDTLIFYSIDVDPLFLGDGQTAPKQAHALANTTKSSTRVSLLS